MTIIAQPSTTEMSPVLGLTQIMDNLVELERQVHPDLRVYRWRPQGVPALMNGGVIWNWLGRSPNTVVDTGTWRDTLAITVRIGIKHTDIDQDMARVETYADAFIMRVDPVLDTVRPLGVRRASRSDMGMVEDEFNDVPVLAVEFLLSIERDKHITKKSFG